MVYIEKNGKWTNDGYAFPFDRVGSILIYAFYTRSITTNG